MLHLLRALTAGLMPFATYCIATLRRSLNRGMAEIHGPTSIAESNAREPKATSIEGFSAKPRIV